MRALIDSFPLAGSPLHYRLEGPPGAPCVVLSNSHATNLHLWDAVAAALRPTCQVLRYDQRGHGLTPATSTCTFDTLVDDLIALLDALDIGSANLVGVSMGAVTVLRAAARYPERVERVLASDGQWAAPVGAAALWEARMTQANLQGMRLLAEDTVARWLAPASQADAALVQRLRAMVADTSVAGYVACARAMQDYDFRADYPGLRQPVTYVVGADDGRLPGVMQAMAAATPRARYQEIPAAGHLPCIERPDAFLACVRAMLADSL